MREHVAGACIGRRLQQPGNADAVLAGNSDGLGSDRRHPELRKNGAAGDDFIAEISHFHRAAAGVDEAKCGNEAEARMPARISLALNPGYACGMCQ